MISMAIAELRWEKVQVFDMYCRSDLSFLFLLQKKERSREVLCALFLLQSLSLSVGVFLYQHPEVEFPHILYTIIQAQSVWTDLMQPPAGFMMGFSFL